MALHRLEKNGGYQLYQSPIYQNDLEIAKVLAAVGHSSALKLQGLLRMDLRKINQWKSDNGG